MTLTLELPAALERRLARQAEADGTTVEAAAVALLDKVAPPEKTWAEVCAPLHEEFLASGMTDEELELLIKDAIRESRSERRARAGGS